MTGQKMEPKQLINRDILHIMFPYLGWHLRPLRRHLVYTWCDTQISWAFYVSDLHLAASNPFIFSSYSATASIDTEYVAACMRGGCAGAESK
mmetsp:Transcript_5310/g.10118  ORF Transcript_5310/g.10118 Transcript_5310/m.10118 type:complete len:92 (+) Transcript_5310:1019-1294(+)